MSFVGFCHRCPHVQKPPYKGRCDCLHDLAAPVDIIIRARSGVCPAGYFTGTPLPEPVDPLSPEARKLFDAESANLGDEVEAIAKAIGADKLAAAFEELTGWDCGCDARKRLLNKLPGMAKAWGWLVSLNLRHDDPL